MKKPFLAVGALILALGAARLLAQEVDGPEEAGKEFAAYVARQDYESLRNLVARDSWQKLGRGGVDALLRDLRLVPESWQTKTGESGTVQVTPVFESKAVICRRDGRFWRVDLLATASKWMKLDEITGPRQLIRDYSVLPQFGAESCATCATNLQAIAVALKQYQEDYNDQYPPADRWNDALRPYLRDEKSFHCPAAGKNRFGYAFNTEVGKVNGKNARPNSLNPPLAVVYEAHQLTANAKANGLDAVFRHEENAYFLLTDGTVRAYAKGQSPAFSLKAEAKKPPSASESGSAGQQKSLQDSGKRRQ